MARGGEKGGNRPAHIATPRVAIGPPPLRQRLQLQPAVNVGVDVDADVDASFLPYRHSGSSPAIPTTRQAAPNSHRLRKQCPLCLCRTFADSGLVFTLKLDPFSRCTIIDAGWMFLLSLVSFFFPDKYIV